MLAFTLLPIHTHIVLFQQVYSPPVEEFVVSSLRVEDCPADASATVLPPCDSFGLVLVYHGEGNVEAFDGEGRTVAKKAVHKGQVYGLFAGHGLRVTSVGSPLTLFKANVNCERVQRGSPPPVDDISSAL